MPAGGPRDGHRPAPGPAPRPAHARGRALREARGRPRPLRRLRAPLPDPARPRGHLPRPLQRGRRAARSPSATWPGSTWTRSRRSRSSTCSPGRRRSPSACSVAIITAAYCQNWLTSQALRDPEAMAPAQEVSAAEIVAAAKQSGAAHRDLDLQRAAHHQRVGGRGLPPREGRGPPLLLRLERQRHRGGAGVPAPVRVALQGGPQGLPRPPLPRPRRHARARAVDDPRAPREGHLGRGGDARRARPQRLDGGAARHRPLPGLRVARHPLARDGVPPRLPDGGPGADLRARAPAGGRDRRRGRAALRLRRQPARRRPQLGEHVLPRLPRACSSSVSASACLRNRLGAGGRCPDCRQSCPGCGPETRKASPPRGRGLSGEGAASGRSSPWRRAARAGSRRPSSARRAARRSR